MKQHGILFVMVTIRDVLDCWGVSPYKVRRALDKGEIRHRKSGGTILMVRADVVEVFGEQLISMEGQANNG